MTGALTVFRHQRLRGISILTSIPLTLLASRIVPPIVHILFLTMVGFASGQDVYGVTLSLDEAIDMALKNSYQLEFARARGEVARYGLMESWRALLPQVGVSYSWNKSVGFEGRPDSLQHQLGFNATQPLYDARLGAGREASEMDIAIADIDRDLVAQNIAMSARRAYLRVIGAKRRIEMDEKLLAHGRLLMEITQKEYEIGVTTKLDLLEMQLRLNEVELEMERARNNLQLANLELVKILGLPSGTPVSVDDKPLADFSYRPLEIDLEDRISRALERRGEIRRANLNLRKSEISAELERYAFLPRVTLGGSYTLSGDEFPPRDRGWGLSLGMDFSIYGSGLGGSTNASGETDSKSLGFGGTVGVLSDFGFQRRAISAEAELKRTTGERDMVKAELSNEVRSAYYAIKEGEAVIELARRKAEIAREKLEIISLKLDLGEAKRADLLQAEAELTRARVEEVMAIIDYILAEAEFRRATGERAR
ncbi:MAG: TolC family protein [bacterium]